MNIPWNTSQEISLLLTVDVYKRQINTSFKNVYEQMEKLFTEKCMELKRFRNKKEKQFIRKILVAGDDITYVCTGRIALATVPVSYTHLIRMKR